MDKSYSELIKLESYKERLMYLQLLGHDFNSPRFMNQNFYKSKTWLQFKRDMHTRDLGFDLGVFGVYIHGRMILHHINPVKIEDLEEYNLEVLLNPENVITSSDETHNKIHYQKSKIQLLGDRRPGDTKLW